MFLDGHVGDITKTDATTAGKDSKRQCGAFHLVDEKDIAGFQKNYSGF